MYWACSFKPFELGGSKLRRTFVSGWAETSSSRRYLGKAIVMAVCQQRPLSLSRSDFTMNRHRHNEVTK
jgi:hypothetical protein